MEHRWGQRQKLILRIRLSTQGHSPVRAWLTNVSLSGAYLMTAGALPLMGSIRIDVDERSTGLPGAGPLQLHGRIVRHDAAGIGIEWEKFAAESLAEMVRIAALADRSRIDLARAAARSLGMETVLSCDTSAARLSSIEP